MMHERSIRLALIVLSVSHSQTLLHVLSVVQTPVGLFVKFGRNTLLQSLVKRVCVDAVFDVRAKRTHAQDLRPNLLMTWKLLVLVQRILHLS